MSTLETDVLVIGLGPAGAAAAAAAARAGCRVIAVERRREAGRPVQCAEFVPAALASEVAEVAPAVRQPITAMATYLESEAPDLRADFFGYMLDRAAFDAALAACAARAGAYCAFGTSVRSISREGLAHLADGRAIESAVLVGADGPRSLVGRAIGRRNHHLVETRQITVALREPHAATDIFLSAGIPGGYGWLFPKGAVAHLGAGVVPSHQRQLKPILERLHAGLHARGRVGEEILALTGGALPVGGLLTPWGMLGRRLALLAGDAAGLANPVTGAGIAAAVRSGRLAGQAAAAWLGGERAAAADYEQELEAIFRPSLEHAVTRRRELLAALAAGVADARAALRRGWIAYPEYWAV
jgi:geranylgeranyl reductase family protein